MFTWLLGEAWAVDASTVALLAVVMWLDGWRRATSDTIALVRLGLGAWAARTPWARLGSFALVAWWPPIVMPMLVSVAPTPTTAAEEFDAAVSRGRDQLRRVRRRVPVLRGLGLIVVVWIIFGIPLYTARFGGMGLLRGIAVAFVLALVSASLSTFGLVGLGIPWGSALGRSAHLLSPFSAPRAPEVLIAAALATVGPLARIAVLLGDDRFFAWLRPMAYDALHGRMTELAADLPELMALVRGLPRAVLERATASGSTASTDSLPRCPRCARTYRDDVATCAECDDLALVR